MSKTIRRDWLKRQIESGKLLTRHDSHFDGMIDCVTPVANGNFRLITTAPSDINLRTARAWQEDDGTIILSSACGSYTFKPNS